MPIINGTGLGTVNDESHSSLSAYHIQPNEHIRLLLALGRFFSWNNDWQPGIVAENHTIHLFSDIAKGLAVNILELKALTSLKC